MGKRAPIFSTSTLTSSEKPSPASTSYKNHILDFDDLTSDDPEVIPTSVLMARTKQCARKGFRDNDGQRVASHLDRRDGRIDKKRQTNPQPGPPTSKKIKQEYNDGVKESKPVHSSDLKGDLSTVVTVTTRGLKAEDQPRFAVLHVSPLRKVSPVLYQQAAQAAESGTNTLELLHINADAFATFAGWVYNRRVDFRSGSKGIDRDAADGKDVIIVVEDNEEGDILFAVLESYTLAIELEAIEFGNAVLRRACEISAQQGLAFGTEVICAIYERTKAKPDQGGMLRRWIVDEWVWQFDAANVELLVWREDKGLPKEFLFDVVVTQASRLGDGREKHQSPSMRMEAYVQKDNSVILLD